MMGLEKVGGKVGVLSLTTFAAGIALSLGGVLGSRSQIVQKALGMSGAAIAGASAATHVAAQLVTRKVSLRRRLPTPELAARAPALSETDVTQARVDREQLVAIEGISDEEFAVYSADMQRNDGGTLMIAVLKPTEYAFISREVAERLAEANILQLSDRNTVAPVRATLYTVRDPRQLRKHVSLPATIHFRHRSELVNA